MDISGSFNDVLDSVIAFIPKLVVFLLVLLIGWLVAKALRKAVTMLLDKVGFERAVERGGIGRALEGSKYNGSELIAAVVYWAILLIALQIAFGVLGPNPVSNLLNSIVGWLPSLIVAVVIVVVAAAIASALYDITSSALSSLSFGNVLARVVQGFVIALGVIAALNQIGVATAVTTPVLVAVLATVAGVIIVGVGGGMVKPMQQRWERWLGRAEEEIPAARARTEAYNRGREDAARGQETPAEMPSSEAPVRGEHSAVPTEDIGGSRATQRRDYP